jgi:hypothetical protein
MATLPRLMAAACHPAPLFSLPPLQTPQNPLKLGARSRKFTHISCASQTVTSALQDSGECQGNLWLCLAFVDNFTQLKVIIYWDAIRVSLGL